MTDASLSQQELRRSNSKRVISARFVATSVAALVVTAVMAIIGFDVEHPRHFGGSFSNDFSDDFDIEHWEYGFPLGLKVVVTAHSARVEQDRLGLSVPIWQRR